MKNNVELRNELYILTIENVSRMCIVYAMNLRYRFTLIDIIINQRIDHVLIFEFNVNWIYIECAFCVFEFICVICRALIVDEYIFFKCVANVNWMYIKCESTTYFCATYFNLIDTLLLLSKFLIIHIQYTFDINQAWIHWHRNDSCVDDVAIDVYVKFILNANSMYIDWKLTIVFRKNHVTHNDVFIYYHIAIVYIQHIFDQYSKNAKFTRSNSTNKAQFFRSKHLYKFNMYATHVEWKWK